VCVVVLDVAGSFTTVVQQVKSIAQEAIAGIKRSSFFIYVLI